MTAPTATRDQHERLGDYPLLGRHNRSRIRAADQEPHIRRLPAEGLNFELHPLRFLPDRGGDEVGCVLADPPAGVGLPFLLRFQDRLGHLRLWLIRDLGRQGTSKVDVEAGVADVGAPVPVEVLRVEVVVEPDRERVEVKRAGRGDLVDVKGDLGAVPPPAPQRRGALLPPLFSASTGKLGGVFESVELYVVFGTGLVPGRVVLVRVDDDEDRDILRHGRLARDVDSEGDAAVVVARH